MGNTRILQIGLGPLGIKTAKYIDDKISMSTVAAVDINPGLAGKDLGDIAKLKSKGISIKSSLSEVDNIGDVDVVVLTTSSSMQSIYPQVDEILDYKIPIVSTCEELTFPWKNAPEIAEKIDRKAKSSNVAVMSTGVNPGFLMDTLPTMLTGVCKTVDHVLVKRYQDAITRRIPFQKKIGAGLTLREFEQKKIEGTLRHVGLTESMHFIANCLGWELDYTEDIISPVISKREINTTVMTISPGDAQGVRQVGRGLIQGKEKIKLEFMAAVGSGESYDEITISGEPNLNSRIEGGVNGDIATCAIVLNAISPIIRASPGLKTMADISAVACTY